MMFPLGGSKLGHPGFHTKIIPKKRRNRLLRMSIPHQMLSKSDDQSAEPGTCSFRLSPLRSRGLGPLWPRNNGPYTRIANANALNSYLQSQASGEPERSRASPFRHVRHISVRNKLQACGVMLVTCGMWKIKLKADLNLWPCPLSEEAPHPRKDTDGSVFSPSYFGTRPGASHIAVDPQNRPRFCGFLQIERKDWVLHLRFQGLNLFKVHTLF